MSPLFRQPSSLSDILPPQSGEAGPSRPQASAWPKETLGEMEEWYIPDPPRLGEAGPPRLLPRFGGAGGEADPPYASLADFSPDIPPEHSPENIHPIEQIISSFRQAPRIVRRGTLALFAGCVAAVFVIYTAADIKESLLQDGENGYRHLALAVESMQSERFDRAADSFQEAQRMFSRGTDRLSWWGGIVAESTRFIPGLSEIASGKYAFEAGGHFSAAGMLLARIAEDFSLSKTTYAQGGKTSLLNVLKRAKAPLQEVLSELEAGSRALVHVSIADIPQEQQDRFLSVKWSLPTFIGLIKSLDQHETLVEELLGGNGPRKYLFLLQNNHEMRATGGFIGSYAIMDVNDGVVRRFFVDGIFNPDGQLKAKIIPPKALQKVSAAWSLHDSNWFPDFPVSAEKAIFFYEKTGGPTVDGVITLTPTVMQKLLAVTGPITLPQYGLTVDAENFIPVIQEQVEVKYDKIENQPKKVLADLTALLLERVFALQDKAALYAIAQALVEGLNEKQMLLYMRHAETQALIDEAGWSGRVLPASKDYLSVIHTNINGYKTDGVIDETIRHTAEIDADGSIVDTVAITRTHRGGHMPYEWWNKVNADYLRVYVPEGSELLSAKGATWEFPEAPLDYAALGFRRDGDVESEENITLIDEKSGTRVYRDAGKTVFGAWVYVSPQESVTVEYRYRLPFRVDIDEVSGGGAASYSVLYQKQSGSIGSRLFASVIVPDGIVPIWQTGGNLIPYGREWKLETKLTTDAFAGMIFGIAKQ